MSEVLRDPELTPSQRELKDTADAILAHKPENSPLTFWNIPARVEPGQVRDVLLRCAAAELMLKDGDSLSAQPPSDYWPDLHLEVSDETLKGAYIRAWGWQYEKHRLDPDGPSQPPYDVISFPDEFDWARQLDVSLQYSNGIHDATQTITSYTSSHSAGKTPSLSRDVYASAYAETGYEGHNQKFIDTVSEEDILVFTGLCRLLLELKTD